MQKTWQLVRIELLRKWTFAMGLLTPWLGICAIVRYTVRAQYGALDAAAGTADTVVPIVSLFSLLSSLVFGATVFQPGEKDGVQFFLYHHPVDRSQIYAVRYWIDLCLASAVSIVIALLTPLLLSTSWRNATTAFPVIEVLPFFWLFLFTAAVFFSPLFSSDFATLAISAVYSPLAFWGLAIWGNAVGLVSIRQWWVVGSIAVFICGWQLFQRRWILESPWNRRIVAAACLFGATSMVLFILPFVDFVDLLYLLGIDLMKL